jgi:hypothetical protein
MRDASRGKGPSTDDAARACREEIEQHLHFRAFRDLLHERLFRLLEREAGLVERAIGASELIDRDRGETAPLESFGVDAEGPLPEAVT